MQYVGRAIGSVSKTWSSINPATLSGAIDIIVVEQPDGELACSPFHVRFGKFQLLRPSQKKVDFIVNGEITDLPMKLGDGGEAFFVFETDGYIPPDLQTSPVLSPESSPGSSPRSSTGLSSLPQEEPDYLDIGEGADDATPYSIAESIPDSQYSTKPSIPSSTSSSTFKKQNASSSLVRAHEISKKLTKKNIPSRIEANGDILLDMQGYKSNEKDIEDSGAIIKQLLQDEFGDNINIESIIDKDLQGNIRILSSDDLVDDSELNSVSSPISLTSTVPSGKGLDLQSPGSSASSIISDIDTDTVKTHKDNHFKTLRLTSEQLKCLSLRPGENDIIFSVNKGKATVTAKLFLWKHNVPIVISDIDGTITKSDALGHVLTMLGRDWTHVGVAKLFSDIHFNGYNIIYLTARSVGLADTTRSYLQGVIQDGLKLPAGPVILSPDRTMAALRREIYLKKPEVFKMACLNDIRVLYDIHKTPEHSTDNNVNDSNLSSASILSSSNSDSDATHSIDLTEPGINPIQIPPPKATLDHQSVGTQISSLSQHSPTSTYAFDTAIPNTPFYAGFGNRITDALSYRSVGIPSSRIFTINPEGDVHMELLEMAGYKSSYVSIGELVDQFFPPVSVARKNREGTAPPYQATNQFSDLNYWRSPVLDLSESDDDDEIEEHEVSKIKTTKDLKDDASNDGYSNGVVESGFSNAPLSPRLASIFGRSPPASPTSKGTDPSSLEVNTEEMQFEDDEEEDEDEDLDPDYEYEDEEATENLDDEYDDVDYDDEEEEDYDEDEDLDGDLLASLDLEDHEAELNNINSNEPLSKGKDSSPYLKNSVKSGGLGIANSKSLSGLSTIDSRTASGTFIKAKEMLDNFELGRNKKDEKTA